ncbi:methyltransferase domain-containing protein [Candidatus Calescamantes bacterium]|nr:methyltransferase domain-containing protein [Candidatus Calescamantes bacterium]
MNLPEYLVSPCCKGDLKEEEDSLICENCGNIFPIEDGIPILHKEIDDPWKRHQKETYDRFMREFSLNPSLPQIVATDNWGLKIAGNLKVIALRNLLDALIERKGKVLDVGCGRGEILNKICAHYDMKGVGLDISIEAIKIARCYNPLTNEYWVGDAESLPFRDNSFDLVISLDTLEHLSNPLTALEEMVRVLKPGGKLLVYTLNKKQLFTWHCFLRLITFRRLGVDKGHLDDHDPEKFLDANEVKKLLETKGMTKLKITYFDTFFTLAFNELLYLILQYRRKGKIKKSPPSIFNPKNPQLAIPPPLKWRLLNRILNILYPLFYLIDTPFRLIGASNGFFLQGIKH